nr:hypothetical protein [Tanacetum cinerariifolium]
SLAWKKSDTRDAPPSFSKQQSDPHAEQPVKDIPKLDIANISDSEDTDSAHLPKIKQSPEWLKPIPNDERSATPEPAWSHVYSLFHKFTDRFIDLMSDVTRVANSDSVMLCCCGEGGRLVVVVVVVVVKIGACVVDDAGLGDERSITGTGVDSRGTKEDA